MAPNIAQFLLERVCVAQKIISQDWISIQEFPILAQEPLLPHPNPLPMQADTYKREFPF